MNNKYKQYVKNSERKVKLRLMFFLLLIFVFSMIEAVWAIDTLILVPIVVSVFTLVMYIVIKKNQKTTIKYKLESDIFTNIRYPLYANVEYLGRLTYELNSELKIPEHLNDLIDYIQFMIDNKQMIFIEPKFKINEAVNVLNEVLAQYNIKLNVNDILQRDTEIIKERRKNNIETDYNDLAVIRSLLLQNNLELVSFYNNHGDISKFSRIEGYLLAVIPISKMDNIVKILH